MIEIENGNTIKQNNAIVDNFFNSFYLIKTFLPKTITLYQREKFGSIRYITSPMS